MITKYDWQEFKLCPVSVTC